MGPGRGWGRCVTPTFPPHAPEFERRRGPHVMMNDDDLQAGQPLDEERRPVGLATFLERTWSGLTGLVRPRSAATMFRLADQYRHEGRYEEAADLITEGLRVAPNI